MPRRPNASGTVPEDALSGVSSTGGTMGSPPPKATAEHVLLRRCGTEEGPPPGGDPLAGSHPAFAAAGASPQDASHQDTSHSNSGSLERSSSGAGTPKRTLVRQDTPVWRRFSGPDAPERFEPVMGTAPPPRQDSDDANDAPPMGPTMAPWALNGGAGAGHDFAADLPQRRARGAAGGGGGGSGGGVSVLAEQTRAPWAAAPGSDAGHGGGLRSAGGGANGQSAGAGGVPSDAFSRLAAQQAPMPDFAARMRWPDVAASPACRPAVKRVDSPQQLSRCGRRA